MLCVVVRRVATAVPCELNLTLDYVCQKADGQRVVLHSSRQLLHVGAVGGFTRVVLRGIFELWVPRCHEQLQLGVDGPANSVLWVMERALEAVPLCGHLVAVELSERIPQAPVMQSNPGGHLVGQLIPQGGAAFDVCDDNGDLGTTRRRGPGCVHFLPPLQVKEGHGRQRRAPHRITAAWNLARVSTETPGKIISQALALRLKTRAAAENIIEHTRTMYTQNGIGL
mmetsp:Transcript_38102/g.96420  ORF Transcript_38102/g.96420 Transcript_38102/m.96420 type:complete len:226 (-) Transcript_38102:232-909(-)